MFQVNGVIEVKAGQNCEDVCLEHGDGHFQARQSDNQGKGQNTKDAHLHHKRTKQLQQKEEELIQALSQKIEKCRELNWIETRK